MNKEYIFEVGNEVISPYINSPSFLENFTFQVKEGTYYFEVSRIQFESIMSIFIETDSLHFPILKQLAEQRKQIIRDCTESPT